jgi:hypothetical protein
MKPWKSAPCLAPFALAAGVLILSSAARAQTTLSATSRLHTTSAPSVLNDPIVQRCRMLAARRTNPALDSLITAVDKAAMELRLPVVFDAVADCRAALVLYPNEPAVIIAHYTASEALSVLALGLKFPDSEEEAFHQVLQATAKEGSPMVKQMFGFYLGSAYEYGVGTAPDSAAAMKWYAVAAEAGDPISKRELARLSAAKP